MTSLAGGVVAGFAEVLDIVFKMVEFIIIAAALVSWVSPDPRNPIVQFLYRFTEPIFRPLRRLIPPQRTGGLDFSPLVAILLLVLLKSVVFSVLFGSFRPF